MSTIEKTETDVVEANGVAKPAVVQLGNDSLWKVSVSCMQSYRDGARVLIDHGRDAGNVNDFGPVICFLQRHATELMLKSVIGGAIDVVDYEAELAKTEKNEPAYKASKNQRDDLSRKHELKTLLKHANDLLAQFDMTLGADVAAFVSDIAQYEQDDHSRFRYDTVASKDKERRQVPSFPKVTVIPVESLQERLETLIQKYFKDSAPDEDCSVGRALYDMWNSICQRLWTLGLL